MSSSSPLDWFGRILALSACAGVLVLWTQTPTATDPSAVFREPLFEPTVTKSCPLPPDADPTDLGEVMQTGFSPRMSKLMFLLTRDTNSPADVRRAGLIDASAELIGCVELAATIPPANRAHLDTEYLQRMADLRDAVAMLQLSAIEDDLQSGIHMYDHTRKECARCHVLFKPSSSE